jgi:hypothetical protein
VTEIEAHGEIDEVICEGVTISFVRSSAPDGFRSDGCALPMIPSSASAALYGAALRLWGLRGMEALHRSHPGKSIADIPFRDICEFVARTDFPHGERLFKASCVDEDK